MGVSEPAWADCLRHLSKSPGDNWCAFESPECAGCPNAALSHHSVGSLEDPMKSAEIKGWLHGLKQFTVSFAVKK
jgi:hypothetical protein